MSDTESDAPFVCKVEEHRQFQEEICSDCAQRTCSVCAGQCQKCGKSGCAKHFYDDCDGGHCGPLCHDCREEMDHCDECTRNRKQGCAMCLEYCNNCPDNYMMCKAHTVECERCYESVSSNHTDDLGQCHECVEKHGYNLRDDDESEIKDED